MVLPNSGAPTTAIALIGLNGKLEPSFKKKDMRERMKFRKVIKINRNNINIKKISPRGNFKRKLRSKIIYKPYIILNKAFQFQRSNVSLIVKTLKWGGLCMGWTCAESGLDLRLIKDIWTPFETPDKNLIRKNLLLFKQNRQRIFKILGSSGPERKHMKSFPPKGWRPIFSKVLKRLEIGTPSERKLLTTLLFSPRLLRLPIKIDFSSIVTPNQYNNDCTWRGRTRVITQFWGRLGRSKLERNPKSLAWTDWHLTTKIGPNGHAMRNLMNDCMSLTDSYIDNLGKLGGPKVVSQIKLLRDEFSPLGHSLGIDITPGRLRKLSVFPDMEGKVRVVGILDYFSQSVLKKLHSHLFRILRSIPQDYTFNQGSFKSKIYGWKEYFSCDLKDATDRMPINLICKVLNGYLPEETVESWKDIMISTPFYFKKGNMEWPAIKYEAGNPMGAYSSWGSFALTHHFIVFESCFELKKPWYSAKYCLLGDDILFGDRELYTKYREKLKLYQIDVSEAKTHESKILCEFAKRWIYYGEEITPFPLPALKECGRSISNLVPLLIAEQDRDHLLKCGIPESVTKWLRIWRTDYENKRFFPEKVFRNLTKKALICENLIYYFRGMVPAQQVLYTVLEYYRPSHEKPKFLPEEEATRFIKIVVKMMLSKSLASYNRSDFPFERFYNSEKEFKMDINPLLDKISEDYTTAGLERSKELIRLTPWRRVASRALDQYVQLRSVIAIEQSDGFAHLNVRFPLLIKAVVIPHPCKIFIGRKYDMINTFNSGLLKTLLNAVKSKSTLIEPDHWDPDCLSWTGALKEGPPDMISISASESQSFKDAFKIYRTHPVFTVGNRTSALEEVLRSKGLIETPDLSTERLKRYTAWQVQYGKK